MNSTESNCVRKTRFFDQANADDTGTRDIRLNTDGESVMAAFEGYVAPGSVTDDLSEGNSRHMIFVWNGEGILTAGDKRLEIEAGDRIAVPPGLGFSVTNTSDSRNLDFSLLILDNE